MNSLLESITLKVLAIAVLAVLLLIPLEQVRGLIAERNALREQAVATIAQRWGQAQRIGGPVLYVPRRVKVAAGKQVIVQEDGRDVVLPDRLVFEATMAAEKREYGIYETPVYTSDIRISGAFADADFDQLKDADSWLWDRAELRVPVSDVRGIHAVSPIEFDGTPLRFGPSAAAVAGFGAIAVPVAIERKAGARHAFTLTLTLAGTQSLSFLPLGRTTEVALKSSWPDPSFDGAFLPARRDVGAGGFDAHWSVLDLNRGFGQHWREGVQNGDAIGAAAFGVNLYQPAGIYQQNERAGKYGVLFIALTFVAFFLFEVLRKLRVHPVQYLLVGLALATFYLVLLALSEQVGFAWAYLCAASAVVVLVGGYACAVLRTWRGGLLLGALVALVYALLYELVVSEEYALLMGSIALLVTVGVLMFLTRRIDWYAYGAVKPQSA
jgi:inner membrane protein